MKYNPTISVIMPVYNGEKYLREAIDSVLAQTYTNFELLLINDGSTDKSKEIILSYNDSRIRYIENEKNLKLIATLNRGIALSQGDLIARMDADDVCMPNRFEEQVSFFNKHDDIDLCGSWAIRIDGDGKTTGKIRNIDTPELLKCASYFTCPFVHPSVMIRSRVLKANCYNPDFPDVEDTELWHRLALQGCKMANIPHYLLKYRWHGENISAKREAYVIAVKKRIFRPSMEAFLEKSLTEEEMDLHLFSFLLYHFGERQSQHVLGDISREKLYLETLYRKNIVKKTFRFNDWAGFLFSRWVVCCLTAKKPLKSLSAKMPWYNPIVLYKAMKMLLYK